ncbi:MAG: hypothetical protein ACYCVD_02705 [Desulfitobacteriaceae bacterium]
MDALEERIFVDAYKEALGEVEYAAHVEKSIKLGRDIINRLGPDGSLIFLKYEMSVCLANVIHLEKTYQLGLRDGELSKGCLGKCAETYPAKYSVI